MSSTGTTFSLSYPETSICRLLSKWESPGHIDHRCNLHCTCRRPHNYTYAQKPSLAVESSDILVSLLACLLMLSSGPFGRMSAKFVTPEADHPDTWMFESLRFILHYWRVRERELLQKKLFPGTIDSP